MEVKDVLFPQSEISFQQPTFSQYELQPEYPSAP